MIRHAALALLLVAGCSTPSARDLLLAKPANAYPAEIRWAILQLCEAAPDSNPSRCSCRLEAIQRAMTAPEFQALVPKLIDGTAANDPRWQQVLSACP